MRSPIAECDHGPVAPGQEYPFPGDDCPASAARSGCPPFLSGGPCKGSQSILTANEDAVLISLRDTTVPCAPRPDRSADRGTF
jgi:hypothetical protein